MGGFYNGRERFARFRAKAHLSDDETVAKMGHPGLWLDLGPGPPALRSFRWFALTRLGWKSCNES